MYHVNDETGIPQRCNASMEILLQFKSRHGLASTSTAKLFYVKTQQLSVDVRVADAKPDLLSTGFENHSRVYF